MKRCRSALSSIRSVLSLSLSLSLQSANMKSATKPIQPMHVYLSSAPYVGFGAPSSMYMGVPPYGSSLFNGSSMSPYDVPFSGGSTYPYNYGSRLSGGSPYRPLHIACSTPYSSGSMMGNGGMYGMPPLMDRCGLGMGMAMGHADMDLISGKAIVTPVFDRLLEQKHVASKAIESSSSGVVIVDGTYALHARLRSLLDIRVALILARWNPVGACRPVIDEAPVFYPTIE